MGKIHLKIKNLFISYWPHFIGFFIISSVAFYYILTNNGVQVFDYDMIEQGVHFVLHGYRWMTETSLPLWDFNHFMGANVFTHGFYWLFSPFWLLFLMSPKIENIPYLFMYVNLLKHLLLFVFSVFYFKSIRKTNLSSFAGASILTFSGFALAYYNYSHFIDVFLFVPLVLMFIEQYLTAKRKLGLVLTVFVMAIINGYLLYLFTPYFFIYTLLRYRYIIPQNNLKKTLKDGLIFLSFYILSIGLAAFIFIPSISAMLGSPRLQSSFSFFQTIHLKDAFRYLTGFIQPIVDRNNFNPLINKYLVPSFGWSGGAAVYSLMISPLLFTQVFFIKDLRMKKGLLISFLGLVVFSIFPIFYFVFQGNFDTRWMVYFSLYFAYLISYLLDHIEDIHIPTLLSTSLILALSLGLSYKMARWFGLQNNEIYFDIAKRNVIVIGLIILLYAIIFIFIKKHQILKFSLVLILIFESYFALYNIFLNPVDSVSMSAEKLEKYQLNNTSVIDAIQTYDSSFYRIDAINPSGYNDPMSKDYMGFTFYSSVYNYYTEPFIRNHISSAGGWIIGSNAGKWEFKSLFGSKYYFDTTKDTILPFGLSYLMKVDDQFVYQNKYFVPLMYTMKEELNQDYWLSLSPFLRMRSMMNSVVIPESNNESIHTNTNTEKFTFSEIYEHSYNEDQKDVLITVEYPRSDELKIEVFRNGIMVDWYYAYEPQYSSVYITVPFDEIRVRVTNLYGVPSEEFINTLWIENPQDYYDHWHERIMQVPVNNIQLGQNSFSGDVNLTEGRWIVTSLAYDPDWVLKVNGKDHTIVNVNGGFIGFYLEEGTYTFKANYFSSKLRIGVILSSLSFLSLMIYAVLLRKNQRRH